MLLENTKKNRLFGDVAIALTLHALEIVHKTSDQKLTDVGVDYVCLDQIELNQCTSRFQMHLIYLKLSVTNQNVLCQI